MKTPSSCQPTPSSRTAAMVSAPSFLLPCGSLKSSAQAAGIFQGTHGVLPKACRARTLQSAGLTLVQQQLILRAQGGLSRLRLRHREVRDWLEITPQVRGAQGPSRCVFWPAALLFGTACNRAVVPGQGFLSPLAWALPGKARSQWPELHQPRAIGKPRYTCPPQGWSKSSSSSTTTWVSSCPLRTPQ